MRKLAGLLILLCAANLYAAGQDSRFPTPSAGVLGNRGGGAGGSSWSPAVASPPNIATNYSEWFDWMNNRMAQFEAHCPLNRTKTYYVSSAIGSDANNGLSSTAPFATRGKALEVINASGGGIRVRFRRGDTWDDDSDFVVTANDITVDAYGIGSKPFFNAFENKLLESANVWTPETGNAYSYSTPNDVAYIRISSDTLGEVRAPFIRLNSSSTVQSTNDSFYYNPTTDLLYINVSGGNPNDLNLEYAVSNTSNGVEFQGDGCRVDNLRADGFGIHRTVGGTQAQSFTNRSSGTEANLFTNLEGYYSNTHVMAHYYSPGAGGKSMWVNCVMGWGQVADSSDSLSMLNSFSSLGGQETWGINCAAKYGALKEYTWSYATVKVAFATAFLSHTSGSQTSALSVIYGFHAYANPISMLSGLMSDNNPTTFAENDLVNARAFLVNSILERNPQSHRDAGYGITSHSVHYGNKAFYWPDPAVFLACWTNARPTNNYQINNYYEVRMSSVVNATMGFFNGLSGDVDVKFYHTMLKYEGWNSTNGNPGFAIDYDMLFSGALAGAGTAVGSRFVNSIISQNENGDNVKYLGLNNDAARIMNNAYFQVDNSVTAQEARNYTNDAGQVILSVEPIIGQSDALLLGAGSTYIMLSHDINGKRRTANPPDIGPVDFSSP